MTTTDPANITNERAARRFHQMRHLERELAELDAKIRHAKDGVSALKVAREATVQRILAAARDEATLPLFEDLDA